MDILTGDARCTAVSWPCIGTQRHHDDSEEVAMTALMQLPLAGNQMA
jgi:hypothetical protein